MAELNKLLARILKKIKPDREELQKEMLFANQLIKKIKDMEGEHVDVVLAGSLARNTHLKGDRDIDIFVLFPEKLTREQFEKDGLRIGKNIFRGYEWEKVFTEHPYIRGNIKGFDVEVVPSYNVDKAELLLSAVDRSPFHNEYVKSKLNERQKDEVRLLRQFLKGIKCYGAELKVSSIPGYVVELLIIKYCSFEKTIKAVAKWKRKEVIDLEHYYTEEDSRKKFDSHFIVVDPVDKNRNVAAALSLTQYSRFIAASRTFLKKPSENFFFGKKEKLWGSKKLKELLLKKELIAIEFGYPSRVVADIIWGQLRRFRKKIVNALLLNEFVILRSEDWTDEKEMLVILIELESLILQKTTKRVGPEVVDEESSERFIKAHKKLIAGPRIEKGRWVIEIERKYPDVRVFLKDYLKKAKKIEKENIRKALNKRTKILSEADIVKLYRKNKEFGEFLTTYLKGKEEFGEY